MLVSLSKYFVICFLGLIVSLLFYSNTYAMKANHSSEQHFLVAHPEKNNYKLNKQLQKLINDSAFASNKIQEINLQKRKYQYKIPQWLPGSSYYYDYSFKARSQLQAEVDALEKLLVKNQEQVKVIHRQQRLNQKFEQRFNS